MITYQDLLEVGENEEQRMAFVKSAISSHKSSDLYAEAEVADDYNRKKNRTIMQFQKLLYTTSGNVVPDNYSANYKLATGMFHRFVIQQNQFLLGNGVTWGDPNTAEKLGKDFDIRLQEVGEAAIWGAVAFGFFNLDHMEVFNVLEFVPLHDEENGALRAGIRFWQIDEAKPLRATLYEEDGYTDYIWEEGEPSVLKEKRKYMQVVVSSEADGTTIYDGLNYPAFPIVPLWANPLKQSELTGIREQIDTYDLIKSGFANTVDEASMVYWTIQNAGGMDDVDLAQFVERIKTMHAALVSDNGATAESHQIDTPYASREALLDRLRRDLYDDYMALDTRELSAGSITATQIRAAYEAMNNKADEYEYCIHEFLNGILKIAGIEDDATFTRSMLVNVQEEVTTVLSAASHLDEEYVTRKILTILGDGDKADDILERLRDDDIDRMSFDDDEEEEDDDSEEERDFEAELDAILNDIGE